MDGSTQMGDLLSSAAHGTRFPKMSHLRAPKGSSREQGWLGNLYQQRGRIATSGLGAVGGRAAMDGLGRCVYRDWVKGCSSGPWAVACLSSEQE